MLENSGFAADTGIGIPGDLYSVNQNYMALMLGREGINAARGTDAQLRQMIDGALTAGITDRLYGFVDRSPEFQAQVRALTENKKLHAQLAYAFYALGRLEPTTMEDLQAIVINLCEALKANFDTEFAKLCALVYSKGDIFVYKNSLEDVIKRASVPLNYVVAGGGEGVPVKPTPPKPGPRPTGAQPMPPRPDGLPTPPKPGQHPVGAPRPGMPTPPKPGQPRIDGDIPKPPGAPRPGMVPKPPSASDGGGTAPGKPERYYTDAEIDELSDGEATTYRTLKNKGKKPEEITGMLDCAPKYADAVAVPPPPAIPVDREERHYTLGELNTAYASTSPRVIPIYLGKQAEGKDPAAIRKQIKMVLQTDIPAKYKDE